MDYGCSFWWAYFLSNDRGTQSAIDYPSTDRQQHLKYEI